MKSERYAMPAEPILLPHRRERPAPKRNKLTLAIWRVLLLSAMLAVLASCSSLGRPERQPSNRAPACNQREPARDSAPPPEGLAVFDWTAWAQAYVASQWAIVDRDNKRAATADCLDRIAGTAP